MSMSRERNFNVNMAKLNSGGKGREKKKSSGGVPGAVAALVLVLLSAVSDAGGEAFAIILVIAAVAAVAYAAYLLGKKYKNARGSSAQTAEALRRKLKDFSFTEKEEELRSPARQQRSYDPELNRQRDMQRRMEQLDSFLKNGIIDKEEYLILKDRYQKQSSLMQ